MITPEERQKMLAQPVRVDTNFEASVDAVSWYLAEAAKERFLADPEAARAQVMIRQLAYDLILRLCHCDLESIVKKRNEILKGIDVLETLSTLDA